MTLFQGLIVFSGISFLGYGIYYFTSTKMKSEFIRFGLIKYGPLTAVLEILGGLGLLAGFIVPSILVLASGGLATLMLLGVGVRIMVKDSFLVSFPALFYFILNAYIFWMSL